MSIIFAKQDKKIVSVYDADNGIKCNCQCLGCGGDLVAKQGSINEWHFAHINNDCFITNETALHKIAKQLIKTNGVRCPNHYINYKTSGENHLFFDDYETEKAIDDIVADGVGIKDNQKYIVEICVTHCCDAKKIEKIKRINIPTIEVYLNNSKDIKTIDDIKNNLSSASSKWILMTDRLKKSISFFNDKGQHKHDFLMWRSEGNLIIGYIKTSSVAIISPSASKQCLFNLEITSHKNLVFKELSLKEATNKANEVCFNIKDRYFW